MTNEAGRREMGEAMPTSQVIPWPAAGGEKVLIEITSVDVLGGEVCFALFETGHAFQWREARQSERAWSITDLGHPCANALEALQTIGRELEFGIYQLDVTGPENLLQVTVGALTSSANTPPVMDHWPPEVASTWSELLDELPILPQGIEAIPGLITINGSFVILLGGGEKWEPAIFNSFEGYFEGIVDLVTFSWFSESGGAPISWDGGGRLGMVTPQLLVSYIWGDVNPGLEFVTSERPYDFAQAFADFITNNDVQLAAAVALEEFDPDATLAPNERQEWMDLLEAVDMDVSFARDFPQDRAATRRILASNHAYKRVSSALRNPKGSEGADLRRRLEEFTENGVIGELMGYNL